MFVIKKNDEHHFNLIGGIMKGSNLFFDQFFDIIEAYFRKRKATKPSRIEKAKFRKFNRKFLR